RTGLALLALAEVGARGRVERGFEAIARQAVECVGELVDRVVRTRLGTVAAGVVRGERVIGVGLLRGLEGEAERTLVRGEAAATAVGVEAVFGVEHRLPFGGTEQRALARGFLVAGEQHEDVALGLEALRLEL